MKSTVRGLSLQISYGPADDRLAEFFIPALSNSVRYDRAAGYFSSSMLAVAAAGVARLIANGGKMRLLCGADLSQQDVEAIEHGEELAARLTVAMKKRLVLPEQKIAADRLRAMAWMVGTGQLEIMVVLPTDAHGRPLPASRTESYYHPKEGIFTDAEGNQMGFSGCVNDSASALEYNYESFMVFNSWETGAYLAQIRIKFERLWEGTEKDWLALPVPEAVKLELLKFRPEYPPHRDPLECREDEVEFIKPPHPKPEPAVTGQAEADQRERIVFQFLRDAPFMFNAGRLGLETCTVKPWPHQMRVADTIVERFPERFLLCDEVGLGKTVEAGLALRQLVLSGRVKRALILVPKSVLVQWQQELYEKFVLDVPRYDGHVFRDVFDREIKTPASINPWDAHPILLGSSQLAKRRDRQDQLLEAGGWDLVIVDEAHHARRKDFLNRNQYRPNRLLELLNGTGGRPGLRDKTRGLMLLTATPMQIDPVEVWDLLKVLGMGGRWGASDESFLRYFDEVKENRQFDEIDWQFVLGMLADHFATGGQWDEHFVSVAKANLGPVEWDQIEHLPQMASPEAVMRRLSHNGQVVLHQAARRHTPIGRYIFRNTRDLLREYRRRGLLHENVPYRDVKPEWIEMRPDEWELYERIEEYILEHYRRIEAKRKGLGFIMTVYRRRLTSSFHAIQKSLEKQLQGLAEILTDDDVEQDDLGADVLELIAAAEGDKDVRELLAGEAEFLEQFISDIRNLGSDSKFEQLVADLSDLLLRRDSVLIFTQYTDTMDYLRDRLRGVFGRQVGCYSGRGGERWDGTRWAGTSKENIKTAFRDKQEIKILLCTESASEGLNLQTCGVLINYDVSWNPMRVEQRIGRIDRIGQIHPRVTVRNYFYQGTVEAIVYQRLDGRITSFENVVGQLQPIHGKVAQVIEAAAMTGKEQREALIAREVEAINAAVRSAEVSSLNLDAYVDASVEAGSAAKSPVTLKELEQVITVSGAFSQRLRPHPQIAGAHLLDWNGRDQAITFNSALFDEHPNTLQFMSFGSKLLAETLEAVEPPALAKSSGLITRCKTDVPWPLTGFFAVRSGDVQAVDSLRGLQTLMRLTPEPITEEHVSAIIKEFGAAIAQLTMREARVAAARNSSEVASRCEGIRRLLLHAAYIDIAKSADSELFDGPVHFSEEAIARLGRYGYPFAGALRVVSITGLKPGPEDVLYRRLLGGNLAALTQRFDAAKLRLGAALKELMQAKRITSPPGTPEMRPCISMHDLH